MTLSFNRCCLAKIVLIDIRMALYEMRNQQSKRRESVCTRKPIEIWSPAQPVTSDFNGNHGIMALWREGMEIVNLKIVAWSHKRECLTFWIWIHCVFRCHLRENALFIHTYTVWVYACVWYRNYCLNWSAKNWPQNKMRTHISTLVVCSPSLLPLPLISMFASLVRFCCLSFPSPHFLFSCA